MTTIELYRKHKAGEIGRDRFLYEVRRDKNLPWVTNVTSYNDAVKILKNKGIISEVDAKVATDPAVDRVNPYFLKKGVEKMLSKEKELTNDSYINALNKAAKQLEKNPHAFDQEMFHNADSVEKADEKLKMADVKKGNHKDKANEVKKVKVKALKEAAIAELTDHLKKKEQISEDVHYKHTVGSEIHTPDGPGKVAEIMGGTLTIEMEDGSHRDYQINVIDKAIEKAQQEPNEVPASPDDVKQAWANWKGKPFGGMVGDPEHFKKPLDLSKLKEYIAKNKDDKEKMNKLKEAIKKLKEAYVIKTVDTDVVVGSGADDSKGVTQAKGIEKKTKKPLKIVNLATGDEKNV